MKRTVIRNETYGLLVFNPYEASYYRIYDENIKNIILNCVNKNDFNELKEKSIKIYNKLNINSPIYINNVELGKKAFVPLEAYFDYTSRCNRSCPYCYNKKFLGNITMEAEMVKKIISDFAELGIMRIHLAGGEPTIDYNGLKNYIEECNRKNMVLSLATNGSFFNDEICDLLTSNELLSVSISIDNALKEKNDITRGKDSYIKIRNGLKKLLEYKEKNNSKTEICFKPVYYPTITREEVNALISLSNDLGIQKLKFANPERCLEHEKGYYGKIKNLYYHTAKMIQECIKENNTNLEITNISNPVLYDLIIGIEENRGCIGAQELITINPDGRITPCLMNHHLLGNIYDYNSVRDFLENSHQLKEYIKLIRSYHCDCKLEKSCRGGCQVRKIVEYGKIESIDPLCPREEIMEERKLKKEIIRKVNVYHSL